MIAFEALPQALYDAVNVAFSLAFTPEAKLPAATSDTINVSRNLGRGLAFVCCAKHLARKTTNETEEIMNMIGKATRLGLVLAMAGSCAKQPPQRVSCAGGYIDPNTGACGSAGNQSSTASADSARIAALETRLAEAEKNASTVNPNQQWRDRQPVRYLNDRQPVRYLNDRQRNQAMNAELRRLQALRNQEHLTQNQKEQTKRDIITLENAAKVANNPFVQKAVKGIWSWARKKWGW